MPSNRRSEASLYDFSFPAEFMNFWIFVVVVAAAYYHVLL
jgi:hypothetical protein